MVPPLSRRLVKTRPVRPIFAAMCVAATPVPLSEAKARLSELASRVRQQHERITLTRNGEPEAVLLRSMTLKAWRRRWKSSATARPVRASRRAWLPWSAVSLAPTWPPFATTWSGAATLARDNRTRGSGMRSGFSLPHLERSPSGSRKPLPPQWPSSTMPLAANPHRCDALRRARSA